MLMFMLIVAIGNAQDIHYSQIDVNPVLLNPAYSGFFDGEGRFGALYRNQWATVSQPFQTLTATAEVALKRRRYQRDGVSLGVIAVADRAGTLSYGTTSAQGILSYFKAFGSTMVSFGLQGGYAQSGFDPTQAVFPGEEEQFDEVQTSYPLVAVGAALYWQPHDAFYFKVGMSAHNLNRPNISYLHMEDTFLEPRYTLYGRAEWQCWSNVAFSPVALVQVQHNNTEVIVGTDFKWLLGEHNRNTTSLTAGLHYRLLDAVYFEVTLDYNLFLFNFCYDVNLSHLTPASYSVGAFEVGVVYRLNTHRRMHYKALPCPII